MGTTNPQVVDGQLSPDESSVPQSAQAVIEELRYRAFSSREAGLAEMAKYPEKTIFHYGQYCYAHAFREMLQWLDELSGDQATPVEHGSETQ